MREEEELLTTDQRLDLMQIPEDEWIMGTYYTFSKRDLDIINKRSPEYSLIRRIS
ncbi:hypothetical protein J2Y67_002319 [Neobacillus niacini]|nr:hypothetical protein [Neobacillus niacini]